MFPFPIYRLLQLGLDDALEGDGVSGKLADAFPKLLNGHLVLIEVETEAGFVVDVSLLLNVERRGGGGIELLGDRLGRVEKLLEKVGLVGVSVSKIFTSEKGF